jgi:hypothetical protein
MCDMCKKLDFDIARCEDLKLRIEEPLFVDGLEALVQSYREEKLALHTEEGALGSGVAMNTGARWPTS